MQETYVDSPYGPAISLNAQHYYRIYDEQDPEKVCLCGKIEDDPIHIKENECQEVLRESYFGIK